MERLEERTRKGLGNDYATLSDGVAHYQIAGPAEGTPVVLVHGAATPMFVWDPVFQGLVDQNYRVLRFDLFGRGFSDRPRVKYTLDLYITQLKELIDFVGFTDKINLVGWSMGGAISAAFTSRFSEKVDKVAFIAPAGFPLNLSLSIRLLKLPLVGEILTHFIGEKAALSSLEKHFFDVERFLPEYVEKFKEQLRYEGFLRAMLSTVRHLPEDLTAEFKRVGDQNHSTLLIWGKRDEVTPFSNSEMVKAVLPTIEFFPMDNAKHAAHYEKSEAVLGRLIPFLKK
jgi:pimeloyl-ACP methyl ester carboxylesterase